ncbi:hypothetical protein BDN72DRAFT_960288 [Pluteus cervinus]|uniref:Uncharacterized protein n=1 Tax=Pluteus cervinus TaxID=181527 RepID=A0ACD3ARC7_9AGAR|nr:hypothetical protein BDN72DRAFT_960288 [Pluteus cervinus]
MVNCDVVFDLGVVLFDLDVVLFDLGVVLFDLDVVLFDLGVVLFDLGVVFDLDVVKKIYLETLDLGSLGSHTLVIFITLRLSLPLPLPSNSNTHLPSTSTSNSNLTPGLNGLNPKTDSNSTSIFPKIKEFIQCFRSADWRREKGSKDSEGVEKVKEVMKVEVKAHVREDSKEVNVDLKQVNVGSKEGEGEEEGESLLKWLDVNTRRVYNWEDQVWVGDDLSENSK